MTNNLKAERTLTAEELQGEFARIIREEVVADYTGALLGVDRAVKALASMALQSLSTQQPMGEDIDVRLYHLHVEALAEIKAAVDGESDQSVKDIIYGLLDEIAALHPNQESGE